MSLNYTLKQMLGISVNDVNSVHDSQNQFKVQGKMSNLSSGKIGDSAISLAELHDAFDNKYVQKTSYQISK